MYCVKCKKHTETTDVKLFTAKKWTDNAERFVQFVVKQRHSL